eukprot:732535-Pleurochrysis_carterae.AAC.1
MRMVWAELTLLETVPYLTEPTIIQNLHGLGASTRNLYIGDKLSFAKAAELAFEDDGRQHALVFLLLATLDYLPVANLLSPTTLINAP